jgi:hypothetical protein
MLKVNILTCLWEQFEDIIRKTIGSDLIWEIRPGDTEANRQAIMESSERMLEKHNGSLQDEGDTFIGPDKTKPVSPKVET